MIFFILEIGAIFNTFAWKEIPARELIKIVSVRRHDLRILFFLKGEQAMQVKDTVKNEVADLSRDDLIQKMKDGRQVDLILNEKKTDDVGYLTWDMEQWSTVDGKRFIRTYQLEGRVLSEYTSHNIHDLKAYFFPDEAKIVQLS